MTTDHGAAGVPAARPAARPTGRRTRPDPTFPEATLQVTIWPDPVLDHLGHDPRSGYVEQFWLPILGPTCLLLDRRLAAEVERRPEGFEVDCARWAQELGIGMKGGRHGPFWRAVERACRFGAARRNGSRLAVRRRLPPLTARQIERLPDTLRASHERWAQARLEQPRRPTVARWTPQPDAGATVPEAPGAEPLGDAA